MNDFGPHLKVILREMSHRVGLGICEGAWNFFKKNNWYWEHTWNKYEESDFVNWLANYFYNNKEARLELTSCYTKNKACCRRAAEAFVWNYGWKVINEP